ncbi:uncharacterized protein LOC115663959 [Syzygium oleosum]|uniref:uncharacterized protein LOC115663959 n=1 Tax=Syzygium oleosum TaxID=219896 RepID=UPI0024BB11EC|nr:uncharacterized protein LOC115663959 [Syzygium oleosum]
MANISDEDDLDLESQVRIMNKPSIKTFTTKEGDTIDCVDINKQPALDHPLLKNHKVQKEPNLHVSLRKTSPITKSVVSLTDLMVENIKYGGGGRVTVYNLTTTPDQFTSHHVWIESGPSENVSMIIAGWMVAPPLFGDTISRLFTYWTGDGYRNGCYNALCPGFVQVSREVTPGFILKPTSTYGGDLYELAIDIEQDRNTGNWWLVVLGAKIKVGYWPKELFSYLRDGSQYIAWGGIGSAGSDGICPPMGNGHMPDDNLKHAAIFRQLHWVRSDGKSLPPSDNTREWVDRSNVYGLVNHHHVKQDRSGYAISFGGPGGYCRG